MDLLEGILYWVAIALLFAVPIGVGRYFFLKHWRSIGGGMDRKRMLDLMDDPDERRR